MSWKKELEQARKVTETNPSEAQIAAENYRKGTVRLRGLEIAIENPKGSVRRGTDKSGKNGSRKWPGTTVTRSA